VAGGGGEGRGASRARSSRRRCRSGARRSTRDCRTSLRAATRDAAGEASRASARETERELRAVLEANARETRAELAQTLTLMQQTLLHHAGDVARTQNEQIDTFRTQLASTQTALSQGLQSATSNLFSQSQGRARGAGRRAAPLLRGAAGTVAGDRAGAGAPARRDRQTVETRLATLQEGNERRLEQMRVTVDEKLHATLETRLGESFRQVADRLEQVHKGLGEMQVLARDVGSLNRVLTNVKTRGTFGEVQLASLLEQVFAPDQYASNVETVPGSGARVEFAIRLPGHRDDGVPLWLPIDAKFPREDYERLLEAQERADPVAAEAAAKALEKRILSRRARSARSTSRRPTPRTSRSCSCRPRASMPRRCAGRGSWRPCIATCASRCAARRRCTPR
jgi:DNA recombination protein RmuC